MAMKDSRLLGVIKNISVGSRQGDVFVFARALVIVRGDAAAMWVRAVGMQFGALGGLLSGLWLKKEEEKSLRMRSGLSPEQLAALDPKNCLIPIDQVIDARLSRHFLSRKLVLQLAAGSSQKLGWRRGENDDTRVTAVLREAFGTRFADEERVA
jgi:hypothetical protein